MPSQELHTEVKLSNNQVLRINQLNEEHRLFYLENTFLRDPPDTLSSFGKFVLEFRNAPFSIRLLVTHKNNLYLKDSPGRIIDETKDMIFLPTLVNIDNIEQASEKIRNKKSTVEFLLKKRSQEFQQALISFINKAFISNIFIFARLYHNERGFQRIVNKNYSIKELEKNVNADMMGWLDSETTDELKNYLMIEDVLKADPILIRDFMLYAADNTAVSMIDHYSNLINAFGFKKEEYDQMVQVYESCGLVVPIITYSYCNAASCDYKAVSLEKAIITICPRCNQKERISSIVVYTPKSPLKELIQDSFGISILLSQYLKLIKEYDVYAERYVINVNTDPEGRYPEQIDVLLINKNNEGIIFECKSFQHQTNDHDAVYSAIHEATKQLTKKMKYLNVQRGYIVTNIRESSALAKDGKFSFPELLKKLKEKGELEASSEIELVFQENILELLQRI